MAQWVELRTCTSEVWALSQAPHGSMLDGNKAKEEGVLNMPCGTCCGDSPPVSLKEVNEKFGPGKCSEQWYHA